MERRETRNATQGSLTPEVCEVGPFSGYARLHWIHSAAQKRREQKCFTLMHHLNATNLRRAFRELNGSRASGIDQVTKSEYERCLTGNLRALEERIARGGWRPKPSREILIPKPTGGTRPIAVGCLEDKIVQTLIARILEAIYEPQFSPQSFGFRRDKSAHQALTSTYEAITKRSKNCVVVEMDVEKFFDSMDHEWLMNKLGEKIGDAHLLRLIRRMLRNSVLDHEGVLRTNERGTPQGSPLSPILANIYLHFLLDEWFEGEYGKKGQMVRYADDAVFMFADEQTARDFRHALEARLKEGGLGLNAEKSSVVPFSAKAPKGTVSFLGFEFFWGRASGYKRVLKVKTSPKKLHRCIQAFKEWIKQNRNRNPTQKLWDLAASKLRGHFNYFGVTFNQSKLSHFHYVCVGLLYKWLNRRSQKRSWTWEQFKRRLWFQPLPKPPLGFELTDITLQLGSKWNRKPKSRMRKLRTSGSERSFGQQCPLFT